MGPKFQHQCILHHMPKNSTHDLWRQWTRLKILIAQETRDASSHLGHIYFLLEELHQVREAAGVLCLYDGTLQNAPQQFHNLMVDLHQT